jgi:hypothetical protein
MVGISKLHCPSSKVNSHIKAGGRNLKISPQHLCAPLVLKKIGEDKYKNYFKFAFVRNPWDRLVSEYFHRKVVPPKTSEYKHPETFEKFVYMLDSKIMGDTETRVEAYDSHLETQMDFLTNKQGKIDLDFVGKFENLDSDFNKVIDTLKIETYLPHANKSKSRLHYSAYYNDKIKKMVERLYSKDIDTFKYIFKK